MNLLKRITTSVSAHFENSVSQLENHDAIVHASIKKTKQSYAKAKARMYALQNQMEKYQSQINDTKQKITMWQQRAIDLAESNQEKALHCMQRMKSCEQELIRLQTCQSNQENLIESVNNNLQKLQNALDEMSLKHNLMRSRQSVAHAQKSMSSLNDESLNETFERWESLILENEIDHSDCSEMDILDKELSQKEQEKELKQELEQLTNQKNNAQ